MTESSQIYVPINQEAIDALIERNASLVKGLTEETKKGIIQELTEGMIKGGNRSTRSQDLKIRGL